MTRIGVLMVGVALVVCLLSGPARGAEPAVPLPAPPAGLAFVTGNGAAPDQVSVAASSGAQARLLGPGDEPLLSPDGTHVAASLFGSGGEKGPALALYDVTAGGVSDYLQLERVTVQPLAWSADSRYLALFARSNAVKNAPRLSSLDVLDTQTGTIDVIAHGVISGASFSPDSRDLLVFAKAPSELLAPVDLYTAGAQGGGLRRLTADGRSLNPVWGRSGIAYDRERLRRGDAPVYEIWLRTRLDSARSARQLTRLHVRSLVSGLVPLDFSADGSRLLAEFVGEDTSEAWTVSVAARRARRLTSRGRPVLGEGISADGSTVLAEEGFFEEPPSSSHVVSLPFGGGSATVLVPHGADASWNG